MKETMNKDEVKDFLFNEYFDISEEYLSRLKNQISLFFIPITIKEGVDYVKKYEQGIEMLFILSLFFSLVILPILFYSFQGINSLLLSLCLGFLFFCCTCLFPIYKIFEASLKSEYIKKYNDYKKIDDKFYDDLSFVYNYKDYDVMLLINKMKSIDYDNEAQNEFSNIIFNCKIEQIKKDKKQQEIEDNLNYFKT